MSASTSPRVSGPSARCTLRMSARSATSRRGRRDLDPRPGRVGLETEPREVLGEVVGEPARPDHEVASEGLGTARQLLGDAAEAEQPERRAVQPARLRVLLLVPASGPQVGDVVRDPPVEREDQAERELGHGDRVPAGAVRDVDAASRRGGDVDRVVAGAGADDEREAPGVHDRLGDLGRPDDQHRRLRLAECGGERRVLERRVVDDVAADGGEAVEARSFELVRDEDSHEWLRSVRRVAGSAEARIDRARRRRMVSL